MSLPHRLRPFQPETNMYSSVHGLKSIGYVQLVPYTPPPAAPSTRTPPRRATAPETSSSRPYVAIALGALALAAAFTIPYVYK